MTCIHRIMIRPHGAVLPTGMGMAEMPVELFQSHLSASKIQERGCRRISDTDMLILLIYEQDKRAKNQPADYC